MDPPFKNRISDAFKEKNYAVQPFEKTQKQKNYSKCIIRFETIIKKTFIIFT